MTKLGSRSLHFHKKKYEDGVCIGHRIDYYGVGAMSRAGGTYPTKVDPSTPHPPPPPLRPPTQVFCRVTHDELKFSKVKFSEWQLCLFSGILKPLLKQNQDSSSCLT